MTPAPPAARGGPEPKEGQGTGPRGAGGAQPAVPAGSGCHGLCLSPSGAPAGPWVVPGGRGAKQARCCSDLTPFLRSLGPPRVPYLGSSYRGPMRRYPNTSLRNTLKPELRVWRLRRSSFQKSVNSWADVQSSFRRRGRVYTAREAGCRLTSAEPQQGLWASPGLWAPG